MTATAARRARLLRLRTVEHRVAAQRLDAAENALRSVQSVAERADGLHRALTLETGNANGLQLQSANELSARLNRARASLRTACDEAMQTKQRANAARAIASAVEDQVARANDTASRIEAAAAELRRAAAMPPRRKRIEAPQ